MSKEIKIKSNGLRNELKEIRKSIDKLTNAILIAQTNKQYEEVNSWGSIADTELRHTTNKVREDS